MKFLDKDYYSLKRQPQAYQNHYQEGISCTLRNLILFQCISLLTYLKKIIRLKDEILLSCEIDQKDLKNIKVDESAEDLSRRIAESFQNYFRQQQQQEMNKKALFYILIKCFKQQLSIIIPIFILVSLIKIGISMVIYELFINISEGQTKYSYIYLSVVCVLWYFNQLFMQSNNTRCYFLIQKVNVSLSMLLFGKVTYLSSYCAKSLNLGKLKNLVENDLATLSADVGIVLNIVSLPLEIIGLSTLLIIRLGWPGAVGVAILFFSFVLISCFSQYYQDILEEIANFKDLRIQLTSEVIQGIKFIKMYGWQIAFEKIIQKHREIQINNQKRFRAFRILENSLGVFVGIASGFVVFVLSHYFQTGLSTVKLYACLELAFALNSSVNNISATIGLYYELKLVFERFASILEIKQLSMTLIQEPKQNNKKKQSDKNTPKIAQSCQNILKIDDEHYLQKSKNQLDIGEIKFTDFNGFWKDNFEEPSLKNINLYFKSGVFYGITGKVGSGKSGLLGAITGEMPNYSGMFQSQGKVAFVEQEPVIFSETIKDNIIFGKEFNATLYQQVIEQSCLITDFQILEKGDETLVGQKGITLSGGQKARVSLARALYVEADIYLLDDPISAVDSKIARKIQERCIKPLSKVKTVILVTHQISFLYECDKVIILEQGRLKCEGTPKQLDKNLRQISEAFGESEKEKQQTNNMTQAIKQPSMYSDNSTHKQPYQNQIKNADELSNKFKENALHVNFSTYFNYFSQDKLNYVLLPITIIMYIMAQVAIVVYVRLLSQYQLIKTNKSNMFNSNFDYFWLTLGLILLFYFLLLYFRAFLLNHCIFITNKAIHQKMIHSVVRSPCSYFDITPSGTLNNRFSSDLGILDHNLADSLSIFVEGPISILVVMISICQAYVYFIPIVLSLMILSMLFYKYYKQVIILTMNITLTIKSPIYHRYNEVLNGLTSIRLYSQRSNQIKKFSEDLNRSTRSDINRLLSDRGFAFCITIIGQLIMYGGLFLAVSQNNKDSYQLFASSTILLINFSNLFQIFLRNMINTDGTIISFARTNQIIELKSQFDTRTSYDEEIGLKQEVRDCENDQQTHVDWPKVPTVEISNLSARYREGLPLILNDISFTAPAGKRIGIVGRTGAGKSSIIQVLFRLVEPELGSSLRVGGCDALKMGLHSLRKHISVIPQTPFLFKGTIKQNIDPFEHSNDEQIWRVLEDSGLKTHVQNFPEQLQTDISNSSESFSVGQKQLLCLARALLRKNRILVLDQATSNVDMETDAFIQLAIREKFSNTTVITIAHRLNTIADYDLVLVMQNGRVAEAGHPFELIKAKNKFYQMVRHTGKSSAFISESAEKSYKNLDCRPANQ